MPTLLSMSPSLAACGLAATLIAACGAGEACPSCGGPMRQGALANPELLETSGIASSRMADVLFAHNDSGDRSRFLRLGFNAAGAVLDLCLSLYFTAAS